MKFPKSIALLSVFIIAACVSVAPNPLSKEDRTAIKIIETKIEILDEAQVSWPDYEFELSAGEPQQTADTKPEVLAAASAANRRKMLDTVRANFVRIAQAQMAEHNAGTRPARLIIRAHSIIIPSAIQRIVFGGAPGIQVEALVTDARTGATIVQYPKKLTAAPAGQGIGGTLLDRVFTGQTDQFDRVARAWVKEFSSWLYGAE